MLGKVSIIAPVNGQAVSLEQVPDAMFAEKILGDGMAVIPADGVFVSPVDGEVVSIADSKHAIGFSLENGLGVLIHIGLETVALKGEGFTLHVNVGDKVKQGDLIAEVDLEFLKTKGLNTITPVIICESDDEPQIEGIEGPVKVGETVLYTVGEDAPETVEEKTEEKAEAVKKPKFKINFDMLQKLGKVLMAVIAVMPAAGFMISLGKIVQMAGADLNIIFMTGSVMENIG